MSGLIAHRGLLLDTAAPPATSWNTAVAALPGLWGWWKLDETAAASGVATDSSGNGNHGTYTAAGTHGASGLFAGSSASQTALGGKINLPNFPLAATPVFTIGAFITADSVAAIQSILGADRASAPRCWQFRKSAAHNVEFVVVNTGHTTSGGSINDGLPHLVVAVYDQSLLAAAGRIKLFKDGAIVGTSSTATAMTGGVGAQAAIGARGSANTNDPWGGSIDECFLVDGALSAGQIANLWASRNTP